MGQQLQAVSTDAVLFQPVVAHLRRLATVFRMHKIPIRVWAALGSGTAAKEKQPSIVRRGGRESKKLHCTTRTHNPLAQRQMAPCNVRLLIFHAFSLAQRQ